MSGHKSKAGNPLQQTKKSQQPNTHAVNQPLRVQLEQLEQQLEQLNQHHIFYHHALLALSIQADDVDCTDWAVGAIVAQRQLAQQSEQLRQQIGQAQQCLN